MKAHFKRLFDYDGYMNALMIDAIKNAGSPDEAVRYMAHLLGAQQVWLKRCRHEPALGGLIWPDWGIDQVAAIAAENRHACIDFIGGLNGQDFDTIITYHNSKGESFSNRLEDVLAHMINHGTHHRAQIGQVIKQTNEPLPTTDYILYIRNKQQ